MLARFTDEKGSLGQGIESKGFFDCIGSANKSHGIDVSSIHHTMSGSETSDKKAITTFT